ncbi:MAG: choice-of-anchor D domain-containing protein, partial [Anaerolineales bacterium]|nr:choice-of-anchor D domain-containing protein [Anaerolineales bacterium]
MKQENPDTPMSAYQEGDSMKRTALITLFALLLVSVITNVPNTSAQVSAWHINAGGADYTAGNGDVFVADKAYVAGDFGYTGNKRDFSFTNAIANTDDDPIYQDVASNKNFSYLFDVPNGDYNVTLYFMEPWQDAVGERVFDVSMEGAVVLDNYDIYAAAGARYTAVTETIAINVSDGTLNINFDFVNRYAMVAAISVVSGTPPVPAPEITVAPTSLDYGDVVNGTDSDLSVTVTNDGTDFLDISSLSTTNPSFAVISPTAPLSITMGSSEIVTVRFSPTVTGLYTDTLDIASNDTDEPVVSVALSGNGVEAPPNEPDIAVSPTSVDFGNVAPGGTADQIVTIDNVGLQLLSVSALSTDNGVFTIVSPTAPFDVAAGASQDVTVRFSPTVDGVENGNLTITSNDPDEGTVVVSLTGTGASTPAVAYRINAGGPNYTDTLGNLFVADKAYTAGDFGFTGNKRDFSFTNPVANTDDDALYQDLAANIAFSYLFDLPNGNYDVTLYFMEPWQSAAGERLFDVTVEGTLILDDYDIFVASGGQYTAVTEIIPVTVSDGQLNIDFARVNRYAMVAAISVVSEGGGPPPTDPDISVSPASLNFGQVQLGNTADQIVNVNNVGGQILTVSSITSSNGVFTIVSPTTPFDVGVSGSQAVTVHYTPTAVMVDNGDLTITSNDPDEGTVIVPMTGEGTDTPPPTTNYVNVTTSAGISSSHVINTSICAPDNNPPIGNGAAWGDYDGDGDVDVYLTSQSGTNWLYSNDGDGTFTNVTTSAGVAAVSHTSTTTVFIDYDNDGDQDLFVGGHGGNLFFENNGNGTFTDVTATTGLTDGGRAMTTGWADFNEDGFLDVYIAKHKLCAGDDQQEDKLFINDGDGTFTDVTTAYLCGGTAQCANVMGLGFVPGWLDYDNDGDLDLFLVNDDIGGAYQPTKLWRNDGSDGVGGWNFTEVSVAANASYS